GRAILIVQHVLPHLRCADESREVDRRMTAFEPRKVFAEGSPVSGNVEVLQQRVEFLENVIVQGSGGSAFAGDFGGDALKDFRFGSGIDKQIRLGLAEHIDKSGCYDHSGGIDAAPGASGTDMPDLDDAIAANRDVAVEPGIARSVGDATVHYYQVVAFDLGVQSH